MKKQVLVLLSDHFADWEASYIMPVLADASYDVNVVSLTKEPVVSMGGLQVIPDYDITDYPKDAELLIVVGGTTWMDEKNEKFSSLIHHFMESAKVAAICDAVTFLARIGCLDKRVHTGNTVVHIKEKAPNYKGESYYVDAQSLRSGNLITANGSAAIEFTRDIIHSLHLMDEEQENGWYHIYKTGYIS